MYSVGCVLFEMLEGAHPFVASRAQATMARKLVGAPPEGTRAEVPPPVRDVVRRSLAADPADRHSSAEQFASALT